jgi:hypothetical protein
MGFVLGFLTGLLAAIAGFGLLAYWLCTRTNNLAVARFINGIAQALAAQQPKPRERGKPTEQSVNHATPKEDVRDSSLDMSNEK